MLGAAAVALAMSGCADDEPSFEQETMQQACSPQGIETCANPDIVNIRDGSRVTVSNVSAEFDVVCSPNGGGQMIASIYNPFEGEVVRQLEATPGACYDLGSGVVWNVQDCEGDTVTMAVCDSPVVTAFNN